MQDLRAAAGIPLKIEYPFGLKFAKYPYWMDKIPRGPFEEVLMKRIAPALLVSVLMLIAFGAKAAFAGPPTFDPPVIIPPSVLPGQVQPVPPQPQPPLPTPGPVLDPLEPWTKERVLSKHLDDYLIAIKLSEDGARHQVILYGKLKAPYVKLEKGVDMPGILGAYCDKLHPVPIENTRCLARLANAKIFPLIVFPAAPLMNRIVEQAECEVRCVDDRVVGDAGYFRCALPEATLEQFKLTGTTADEVAREWKIALSDTPMGMGFRTMMFAAAIRDEDGKLVPELSPLISTASALVLSDRDADGDGVPDSVDNCRDVANYDQVIPAGAICDEKEAMRMQLESGSTVTPESFAAAADGSCALIPGAAFNPMGLLLLLPALAIPLARRRRR